MHHLVAILCIKLNYTVHPIDFITENLKSTLEKLDIYATQIKYNELFKLRSMPKLKILGYEPQFLNSEDLENELLLNQLPNVTISVAKIDETGNKPKNGLWEMKFEQVDLFENVISAL